MATTSHVPRMSRPEGLQTIQQAMGLPPGTLTGSEEIESLDEWNSLAVVEFMAMTDKKLGVSLDVERIAACVTIDDLVSLLVAESGAPDA